MGYTELKFEDLLKSYYLFRKGKRNKLDIIVFETDFEENILSIYRDLVRGTYKHSSYTRFITYDPKRREIAKADIRDRIVHDFVYRSLVQIYDKSFYFHSYASRIDKGTHIACKYLEKNLRKVSQNYKKEAWVLKLDIQKFFASIDHKILKNLILRKVTNPFLLNLSNQIIDSFCTDKTKAKGLPLGNSTSQVFSNLYLNELDRFVIHYLKPTFYIRYMDDLVLIEKDKSILEKYLPEIGDFLSQNLLLVLHPCKTQFRKCNWGIDFLGYVLLPFKISLRTKTRKRVNRKILKKLQSHSASSIQWNEYLSVLNTAGGLMNMCKNS